MKKIKISYILNIIISILVLLSLLIMLTGFKFMGNDLVLTATKIEAFKFFTVDSNILIGIISLIMGIYEYKVIRGKKENMPDYIYTLKLIGTISVMLTFLVTTLYLAPSIKNGYYVLYKNANLFFHLVIPLLSLISFIFFEKNNKIKFKYTFLSLLPIIIYGIFYTINILLHIDNGSISTKYDFYLFAQGGINTIVFVFLGILISSYLVTLLIWYLNKKNN